MQRIAAASNLIRDLIGPFCSTLATALLERGFDLGREVLPAIMHALAAGPGSSVPSQGRHPVPLLQRGPTHPQTRSGLALDADRHDTEAASQLSGAAHKCTMTANTLLSVLPCSFSLIYNLCAPLTFLVLAVSCDQLASPSSVSRVA